MDPESSVVRVGSVSKTVTALAVLLLVEQGRIDLEGDVSTLLDDLPIERPELGAFTPFHLLTQTAGFGERLFGQHDCQWLGPGPNGRGRVLVFNNGLGRPGGNRSSVDEIELLKQASSIGDAAMWKIKYEWLKPGVRERDIGADELVGATECFVTSATRGVMPGKVKPRMVAEIVAGATRPQSSPMNSVARHVDVFSLAVAGKKRRLGQGEILPGVSVIRIGCQSQAPRYRQLWLGGISLGKDGVAGLIVPEAEKAFEILHLII